MSMIVNRRDLRFQLFEVLKLDSLLAHPRFDGCDQAVVEDVFDTAETLAEQIFLPLAGPVDAQEPMFVDGRVQQNAGVGDALAAFAEAGLFAAGFDEEFGGLQLPNSVTLAAQGMFSCANIGIANYAFLTIAAAHLLSAFGSDRQKQTFLPPMLEGRWFGTMCLSEPQAGSSLSDIKTRAELIDGTSYRITGSKMWISGGDHELSENIVHLVLAKIPGGPPGVKGISLFVVPRYRVGADGDIGAWNNIALAGLNHKMGQRGTTNCLLNFGEAGDTIGELVGEPHNGLKYMFHMMNEARLNVGSGSVMSALGGYLYSLDYARTRPQGRRPQDNDPSTPQVPIVEHADVKRMLLAQKAAVEGAQALILYCANLLDRRDIESSAPAKARLSALLDILTPMAKSWPSEHCLEANKLAIQVLGGYGYTRDYPVERLYRDNRLNHIHEGTYGIQGIDLLGRKVRMQDGAAFRALLEEISLTVEDTADIAEVAEFREALAASLGALQSATKDVLECSDLPRGLANATAYLDSFGTVVIAWMWLRQAIVAIRTEGWESDCFYAGKVAACRYFFRYVLPRAMTDLALVASLDDTCMNVDPQQFIGV